MDHVLITIPSSVKPIVETLISTRLKGRGIDFRILSSEEPLPYEKVREAISSASGYIVGLEKVNQQLIAAAPRLKVISKFGVGTDNIDIRAAVDAGVSVGNCPGANSNAVAELAIGLIISLARQVPEMYRQLREHHWNTYLGFELRNKTLAILGFGNIGYRVAQLLTPFGCSILAYDSFPNHAAAAKVGAQFVELDEALSESDIISVHLPLTDETQHIINAKRLSLVKRGAIFVNLARGGVVDEDALYNAVRQGIIRSAAIDVFSQEPPFSSPLLTDPRVMVTPHIGASTIEATINMANMALDNVVAGIEGKKVPNPLSA